MTGGEENKPKIAWVTGASSGIGRALALRLAQAGWRVAVSARDAAALDRLAQEQPEQIECFPLDITDPGRVMAEYGAISRVMGAIDLVVLCAGSYARDAAASFSAQQMRALVDLNLMGTVHCLEAVMAPMMARGQGHIAVVASMAGYTGLPGAAGYGATKAGLMALCEALTPELDRAGVRLQVINPGFVATPLTARNDFPMPFMITAEQAADRIMRGLGRRGFEIAFPLPLRLLLRLLCALPAGLRFALTRRMLRD